MSDTIARSAKRWYWQRVTAMLMALFAIIHVVVMIYAIGSGLTAAEVLGRTQGSISWALFYGAFVLLVSVHAAIGVRNILAEWAGLRERTGALLSNVLALILLAMGLRAVWAVTAGIAL